MDYILIFATWLIAGALGTLYINKKLDEIIKKIERRNKVESKSRSLFRHDD